MLCQFDNLDGLENYHMGYRVDSQTHDVTFLYELTPGACSNSFGIQVAKLAGLPQKVINLAKEKSHHFSGKLSQYEAALKKQVDK